MPVIPSGGSLLQKFESVFGDPSRQAQGKPAVKDGVAAGSIKPGAEFQLYHQSGEVTNVKHVMTGVKLDKTI